MIIALYKIFRRVFYLSNNYQQKSNIVWGSFNTDLLFLLFTKAFQNNCMKTRYFTRSILLIDHGMYQIFFLGWPYSNRLYISNS